MSVTTRHGCGRAKVVVAESSDAIRSAAARANGYEHDTIREPTNFIAMEIQKLDTKFADVNIFVPVVYEDDRGFFKETYAKNKYASLGLIDDFVQDSISFSTRNVVRGLHFDLKMSKFIQVLRGRVFDAIVDIRNSSPTYLQWQGFILSENNHRQLYVPPGFAQGFMVLSDEVVFSYKHGSLYDASTEGAIRWNDPTLAIEWPLFGEPRVSRKDQLAPLLADAAFRH